MTCNPEVLKSVPPFALLDAEESAVLAAQVEQKEFAPRERIYKQGQPGGQAYVLLSGRVRAHRRHRQTGRRAPPSRSPYAGRHRRYRSARRAGRDPRHG
jgi:hypothetical protein